MVRSASLAIAIIAPVLPADSAAWAWPCFTALIASPIEVVRARRIAWLGFSSAVMRSVVWTSSVTPAILLVLGELGLDQLLVAVNDEAQR